MIHERTQPVPLSAILAVVPLEPIARLIHERHVKYFYATAEDRFFTIRNFRDATNLFRWSGTPEKIDSWAKVNADLDENSPLRAYPRCIQNAANAFFTPISDLPTEYHIL